MNRSLFRITAYLQLGIIILSAIGCAPTQPFFLNESPDLKHYLSAATAIEYPDVEVESLAETTEAVQPLSVVNHDYEFMDLTLEECISIAMQNAKFFVTTAGNSEFRQNVASQFISSSPEQVGSVFDVAIQQSTTQSISQTVDGAGNRTLPRGVLRANQIGGVEDALAEFDAQPSFFINYATTDRPRNVGSTNTINPQFFTAKDTTQQAAISKRFATGGVATLREQIIYARNNAQVSPISRAFASDYTAIIEAQVQHPLMRNRGTLVNRIPVVLASLNEDVSIADFEIQTRNLVRDVEVAYWNLYVAYRVVASSSIARNSAIATAQFAKLNLENGTGTKQEVAQAEQQYFQFRSILKASLGGSNLPGADRSGVYGNERLLRELMGLASTDGRLIRPIDEPSLARVEFDWEESVAQLLHLSPELRRAKVRIKQREFELISAKNQILPEVNLSYLYRWVGAGDTLGPPGRRSVNFPEAGSSALGELTEGDFQELAVRLEITPPAIGARRELARIHNANLQIAREKAKLQEDERLHVSQLSDAYSKVINHYSIMQDHANRWRAAETNVAARLAEYKGGRSQSINFVLQSQRELAEAQSDYYRALGEYNKSINYVHYLKGTVLANNNITLAEGPWNQKAYWDALERARERSAGKKLQYGVSRPEVIRRGPVHQGNQTEGIVGSGITSSGQAMPPSDMSDPLGLNIESYRDPVGVDDVPLNQLGDTPAEMFSPEPPGMQPEAPAIPGRLEPVPAPESAPDLKSLKNSEAALAPGSPAPANFEQSPGSQEHAEFMPQPVKRRPIIRR